MDRRQLADRVAAQVVNLGGVGVVLAVLFIAFYLIKEAAPLASDPELASEPSLSIQISPALVGGSEKFTDAAWRLFADGRLQLHSFASGELVDERTPLGLTEGETLAVVRLSVSQTEVVFATSTGRTGVLSLSYLTSFEGETATAESRRQEFGELGVFWFEDEAQDEVPIAIDATLGDEEIRLDGWLLAGYADGRVELTRAQPRMNPLTEQTTWQKKSREVVLPEGAASNIALFERGRFLAAAGASLHGYEPADKFTGLTLLGSHQVDSDVVVLQELIGRGSAVLGTSSGTLTRWLLQRRPEAEAQALRDAAAPDSAESEGDPVAPILAQTFDEKVEGLHAVHPTARQRVFVAQGSKTAVIGQGTSGVMLTRFELSDDIAWMNVSPREDYLVVARTNQNLEVIPLDLGFPSVTASALFSKLTYEGLPEPAYTWQSTGGTDEYEPKISLVPLIIGTIKGTIWALLPSIPLAVAGALYCARFLRGRMREIIKPFVELLAGIPSVILGFVGGLYLAPALQDRMLALFILPLVLAAATMLMGWFWARLAPRLRVRFHEGFAIISLLPIYLAITWVVLGLGPAAEVALLDMPFSRWVTESMGVVYEQKNAFVVGLAMGFAVAPLIFTLAEDAYRNVPQTLADASLALGATSWQTAVRVIEPPARPGVIAAVMLGLGRAVGETMIVLMATGGTAITEWNPLQGFRALSANLATELPEAPKGDSLYRTLFLASLLLFALTFVINTLAEIIRVRGRKDL